MINKSFCFLDGLGLKSEQNIWKQGIHDWKTFIETKSINGMAQNRKAIHNLTLKKAERNLLVNNIEFFKTIFPTQEHWRLYDRFQDEALYLDIETSGYNHDITVIGMYDGNKTMTMVKGQNLDKGLLLDTLQKYKLLLTFNGSSFDLPAIQRYFNININMPHIDLRHVCSKIGLNGGLKNIEKEIGIQRHEDIDGISGGDAALLWRKYKATGNRRFMELLVQYNEEDIINLEPLAKQAISQLWNQTFKSQPYSSEIWQK
ncbi:MAG: ribonuclease H-like domain-containing protein [Candidatus Nanoarchaeia archaeon]